MLNNVMIGRYYPVNSLVHKMHPISKLLCILLFIILSILTFDIKFNILLFIILFLMLLNTKVPLKIYLKTIFNIKWLLLFIFLISLLINKNILISLIIVLKLIYVVLYTSILTLTTPTSEITYGLEKIFILFKLIGINTKKLALNLSLLLRLIPTLIDKKNMIMKSQSSRGIDYYNIDLKGKILSYKTLFKPVFKLSIKSINELIDSMEIRLYNIDKKRINFRVNKWGLYDTFMVLLHLSLLVLYIKEVVL